MSVEVTREVLAAMHAAARAAHPREACGILLGDGDRIAGFTEARNVHPTPETQFEIDPQSLIDAHRSARAGGPEIIGYFHSHPTGKAEPSPTDRELAPGDGRVWAIIAEGDVTFWRDDPGAFSLLSYAVVTR